ncbi:MAG: penicillin-binding protein 2 [Chromatiales bacterium]|jgi:cell division protein FtsI (penicillin-binding protein 3)|nr:penicillin-binding protein 2 [Chromatiales bacterium]
MSWGKPARRRTAAAPARGGAAPGKPSFALRSGFVAGVFVLLGMALVARAVHLQVFNTDFLNRQAAARHLRVATLAATRGSIVDRNGEPLAASTPVDSVWVDPPQVLEAPERIPALAAALDKDPQELTARLTRNVGKHFLYLARHVNPAVAARVAALDIPGVQLMREYRRYYPAGEVTGHLLGFTNVDDRGQEGLELAFDNYLQGVPGRKKVLRDRLGRVVEDVESIDLPRPGGTLVSSIDLRIQYLAHRELKAALQQHKASSGSVVVLDVTTGEVLAMVNQPAYNPNARGRPDSQITTDALRNRAVTDILEPGSTLKPLIVAAALESGRFRPTSRIDTNPGVIRVGSKDIEDKHNYGVMDLATILAKSSNVGATMVAMQLDREFLWNSLARLGIGRLSGSGFPGESAGVLPHFQNWRPITQATVAYGYGLSMTPLQLAQSYAVLGGSGLYRPASLVRLDKPPIARRVMAPETARAVVTMMEQVIGPDGTGQQAAVAGYRVAGKTGTARKLGAGGYAQDRHTAVFAGLAPVTDPRFAIAVIIDDPRGGVYFGGQVAAPVFSSVAAGSLRIMAIPPDAPVVPDGKAPLTIAAVAP